MPGTCTPHRPWLGLVDCRRGQRLQVATCPKPSLDSILSASLQSTLRLAQTLSFEPLSKDLIHFLGLLREGPVRRLNLASRQIGDGRIHALGHLGLEDRVVCRLDEEDGLIDDFVVEEGLVFFPVGAACAVPVHWRSSASVPSKNGLMTRLSW